MLRFFVLIKAIRFGLCHLSHAILKHKSLLKPSCSGLFGQPLANPF